MYIGKFHKYAVAGICLVGMQNDHAAHIVKVASDALIKKGFKVMIFNAFTDSAAALFRMAEHTSFLQNCLYFLNREKLFAKLNK